MFGVSGQVKIIGFGYARGTGDFLRDEIPTQSYYRSPEILIEAAKSPLIPKVVGSSEFMLKLTPLNRVSSAPARPTTSGLLAACCS
jgi:hypothetical protein